MGSEIDYWLIYADLVGFYAMLQTKKPDKWLFYGAFRFIRNTTNIMYLCLLMTEYDWYL